MSLASTIAGMITGGLDMAFGGEPSKIEIKIEDPKAQNNGKFLTLQYNPESLKISRSQAVTSQATVASESKKADNGTAPQRDSTMQFAVTFDTYEQRESVYAKYIKTLEMFVGYDQGKHAAPTLLITYGNFTHELSPQFKMKGKLDTLDVEYTMFLKNGTPVRAKATLSFRIGLTPEEQQAVNGMQSPDHAKLVTIKRGETLADVSAHEYDDPGEWRRIARANGIDDPMSIQPGTKLIVPPILVGTR